MRVLAFYMLKKYRAAVYRPTAVQTQLDVYKQPTAVAGLQVQNAGFGRNCTFSIWCLQLRLVSLSSLTH